MKMIVLAGLVALAGCAPMPSDPATPGPQRCDAAGARSLIGSHMGAVTFAPGANVRMVCTTCAATQDYQPNRLNVRFEEATGIIKSVDCG